MSAAPRLTIVSGGGSRHVADVAELASRGLALPHDHASWPRYNTTARWVWARVEDDDGRPISGFAIELRRSRRLPGMRIGRIRRFGRDLHAPLIPVAGELLTAAARKIPRLLRLDVELFDEDEQRRNALARSLAAHGWQPAPSLDYEETLKLPLAGRDDETLLAGCNARTRRNIRRTLRRPELRFEPVSSTRWRARLRQLHRASFERTGGHAPELDVDGMLAEAASGRDSTLIGCFDASRPAAERLIAFAWITAQGDHAVYAHAGAIRGGGSGAPGAVIMWEAIRWARDRGFDWFDLGGVTSDEQSPLAGISTFKRGYAQTRLRVAQSLRHTPSPLFAGIAAGARRMLSGASG